MSNDFECLPVGTAARLAQVEAENMALRAALDAAQEAMCDLPLMDPRVVTVRAAIAKVGGGNG